MDEKIRVIFNAFREHIVEVCDDKSQRDRYIVCPPTKKAALFTRVRVWTFRLLVTAIMACFRRTLSVEIMEFLEKEKLPQTTPEAFIKRRGFISCDLFRDLNTWLLRSVADKEFIKKWAGDKYLCAIDGTRLSLPYTPSLYRKYRQRMDRNHNLARGVFITDLTGRTILAADMVPNKTEERKAALALLQNHDFPLELKTSVFVMDRGYPGLYLMNWFHYNTGGFIIRAKRDTNKQIAAFMDSGLKEQNVTLSLSGNRRDIDYPTPAPLSVRLVRYPSFNKGDEPIVLITDLDAEIFPADKIVEAYSLRWHIETEIGTAKNELQIEIFSGIRECCIRQDFFAAILMYNMESLIRIPLNEKLASGKAKNRYQVDMNCTWALVGTLVEALFMPEDIFDKKLTLCVKFFLRMLSIQRPGRSSPRIKRKIKLSGKYITFTNYKRGI